MPMTASILNAVKWQNGANPTDQKNPHQFSGSSFNWTKQAE